jgi:hypothetical protein
MNPEKAEMRGCYDSMKEILERFNQFMIDSSFESYNDAVNKQRSDL